MSTGGNLEAARLGNAPRILAIGQSHLAALIRAHQLNNNQPANLTFLMLKQTAFQPRIQDGVLNVELAAAIDNAAPDVTIAAIAGNEHSVLGLTNHPQPFDFVLPQEPELPLARDAEILPSGIVAAWMRQRLAERSFPLMRLIRAQLRGPIWALEPPPPQPDEEHIRSYAEPVFQDLISRRGIAPRTFRYKLWRLQSLLLKEFYAASGIGFIPVPDGCQDENGMLAKDYWGKDATHANASFGRLILGVIAGLIASGADS
ncbi:MAG: hypothetical protein JOZ93_18035 [Sinobacteraceae bacterium]|nr:hypothetical protein [Nevskiaceae bacterium]